MRGNRGGDIAGLDLECSACRCRHSRLDTQRLKCHAEAWATVAQSRHSIVGHSRRVLVKGASASAFGGFSLATVPGWLGSRHHDRPGWLRYFALGCFESPSEATDLEIHRLLQMFTDDDKTWQRLH